MKLKSYNTENMEVKRASIPSITVNLKVGTFSINRAACDIIGLKPGDLVQFNQDESNTENWYIEKVKTNGFAVRGKTDESTGVLFNHTSMAREIAGSFDINSTFRMLVAGEPTKFEKRTLHGLLIRASV